MYNYASIKNIKVEAGNIGAHLWSHLQEAEVRESWFKVSLRKISMKTYLKNKLKRKGLKVWIKW
jgi:hypothetical protein